MHAMEITPSPSSHFLSAHVQAHTQIEKHVTGSNSTETEFREDEGLVPPHVPDLFRRTLNLSSVMNHPLQSSNFNVNLTLPCFFGNSIGMVDASGVNLGIPPMEAGMISEEEVDLYGREILQKYLDDVKEEAFRYGMNHADKSKSLDEILASVSHFSGDDTEALLKQCVQLVPPLFFKSNFKVTDTDIFKSINVFATNVPFSSMLHLPDAYVSYLDIVETNLLKQISNRFDSFRVALKNIQELYVQVGKICASITRVRGYISQIKMEMVVTNVECIRTTRRIANLETLTKKLEMIRKVKISIGEVENLTQLQKFEDASKLLLWSKNALVVDLKAIICVSTLLSTITTLQTGLTEAITLKLIGLTVPNIPSNSMLLNQLKLCFSSFKLPLFSSELFELPKLVLPSHESFSFLITPVKLVTFSSDVLISMTGLCSINMGDVCLTSLSNLLIEFSQFSSFVSRWKILVQNKIKDVIKSVIIVSTETFNMKSATLENEKNAITPDQPKDQTLAQRVESLSHFSFLQLLSMLFRCFSSFFFHLCVVKVNLAAKDSKIHLELNDFIYAVGEFIHGRLSKILDIKHGVYSRCGYVECSELVSLCNSFLSQTDYLLSLTLTNDKIAANRTIFGFRSSLSSIFRDYVAVLHEKNRSELLKQMDMDVWTAATIPVKYEQWIKSLESGQNFVEKVTSSPVSFELRNWDDEDESKSKIKNLAVGNETYFVSSSVLVLLDIAASYMSCASIQPVFHSELLVRLGELLKFFQERARNLVLEAEAMKTAGLKSITAKHLALASQSVSFISRLIPFLKDAFIKIGMTAPPNLLIPTGEKALNMFDALIADYSGHAKQIFNKLVDILIDLVDKKALKLYSVIMNALRINIDALPASLFEVDSSIQQLIDSSKTLHRALSMLLPVHEKNKIFSTIASGMETIFVNIFVKIEARISELSFQNRDASLINKKIVSVNVKFILSEMRKFEGLSQVCGGLEKYV